MHAMQEIANQGLQPVRKEEKTALAHIHAHSILAAFSDTTVEEKRMQVVYRLAVGDARLTRGQLDEELAAALKMASESDKSAGWVAKEGAKGAEKYGPKRASMNTVSSEIRAVWGAITYCNLAASRTADGMAVEPVVTATTGFAFAVKEARKALNQNAVKWDGSAKPTDEQKAAKAKTDAMAAELSEYAKKFPIRAGETIADFQKRQQQAVEIRMLDVTKETEEKLVTEACDNLETTLGLELCTMVADMVYARWDAYTKQQQEQASVPVEYSS